MIGVYLHKFVDYQITLKIMLDKSSLPLCADITIRVDSVERYRTCGFRWNVILKKSNFCDIID